MCAQIADIVHPVADWEIQGPRGAEHCTDEDTATADEKRSEYLQRLLGICDAETRSQWDEGAAEKAANGTLPDPVVFAVRDVAGQLRVLQGTLYELIAYAREFSPPGKKYTLKTLADAAGMSTSGVGTCYNEVITGLAAESLQFGALKRDGKDDPRWRVARFETERKTWPDEKQPRPPYWEGEQPPF